MKQHDIHPNDPSTWPASAREFLARREATREECSKRRELGDWVAARGRVTWAALMEQVLYAPERGYYRGAREPIGAGGDFITSPELHPAFGACVARRLRTRWHELGEPRPFRVVEAGGGTGAAAAQILATAAAWPEFAAALDYVLLEPGEAARERQERVVNPSPCPLPEAERGIAPPVDPGRPASGLDPLSVSGRGQGEGSRIRWATSWHVLPRATGVIWANELLDALPVHRVICQDGMLCELWVRWEPDEGGGFVEEVGPLSTPALAEYFAALDLLPPEGAAVEVNLAAGEWLRAAAARLERGSIVLFDYGDTAEMLYGDPRRAGTLRAYRDHALLSDPLAALGTADLTANVDFTTLMRVAGEAGLRVRSFTRQRQFLRDAGIGEWLRRPPMPGAPGHRRLIELLDPDGLGRVRVLELERA
jgi:SAM-dependent MidA family methyltransferase